MKKLITLLTIATLSNVAVAEETSWFDSLKNSIGLGDETKDETVEVVKDEAKKTAVLPAKAVVPNVEAPAALSTDGLVENLTSALDVTTEQASGGMGAILNYVKQNLSTEQFSKLGESLPGLDGLVGQMPAIAEVKKESSGGFGGLMDKASEYSDSVKSINDVKKQFEGLGLKPEMITDFVSGVQSYLGDDKGAQDILTEGLGNLLG